MKYCVISVRRSATSQIVVSGTKPCFVVVVVVVVLDLPVFK